MKKFEFDSMQDCIEMFHIKSLEYVENNYSNFHKKTARSSLNGYIRGLLFYLQKYEYLEIKDSSFLDKGGRVLNYQDVKETIDRTRGGSKSPVIVKVNNDS